MSQHNHPEKREDCPSAHPTTRRGFVTGIGFGVLSLYGLWAAYGAAPTSLDFVSSAGGGMEGMGHGGGGGMSPEEFQRLTYEFIEANTLPDGSVKPARRPMVARAAHEPEEGAHEETGHAEAGHDAGGQAHAEAGRAEDAHAEKAHAEAGDDHAEPTHTAMAGADAHDGTAADAHGEEPIDVYVIATRYGYEPEVVRLDTGVPYRFRFMAVDADHGASINLRFASHMIRCRAKTLTEKTLTFTAPDEYLVYCTVYCGEGHDLMMGKIVVA